MIHAGIPYTLLQGQEASDVPASTVQGTLEGNPLKATPHMQNLGISRRLRMVDISGDMTFASVSSLHGFVMAFASLHGRVQNPIRVDRGFVSFVFGYFL